MVYLGSRLHNTLIYLPTNGSILLIVMWSYFSSSVNNPSLTLPKDIFDGTNLTNLYENNFLAENVYSFLLPSFCGDNSVSTAPCTRLLMHLQYRHKSDLPHAVSYCVNICGSNTMCGSGSLQDENSTSACLCLPGFSLPFISADICVPAVSSSLAIAIGAGVGGGIALVLVILLIVVVCIRRKRKATTAK